MTSPSLRTCTSCGSPGAGRFCSTCGAAAGGGAACPACGSALTAAARFCPGCGRSVAGSAGVRPDRTPWLIAGGALIGLLAMLLVMLSRGSSPAGAVAPLASIGDNGGGGAPPDILSMSPRERFDRLYNRVMQAAQSGDEATVTRFTPMALMAYAQLDTVDADARYHAALLQVHSGDVAGPTALADTILAQHPGHLFGYIVQGTVARWQKNDRALARAYADFLRHYDAELNAGRVEYKEHQTALDEFHRAALQARKSPGAGT